jgi:hypothetical protein
VRFFKKLTTLELTKDEMHTVLSLVERTDAELYDRIKENLVDARDI